MQKFADDLLGSIAIGRACGPRRFGHLQDCSDAILGEEFASIGLRRNRQKQEATAKVTASSRRGAAAILRARETNVTDDV
eukprot:3725645-Pyramimonas_sp.AAC.1